MTNLLLKSAILGQKTGSLPLVQTASLLVDLLAMAADSLSSNPRSNTPKSSAKARYQVIYDALRNSIHTERIPAGLVLLEGSVARLFGTSRAPVRRALELLHHDKLIQRFEGRGYLVSPNGKSALPLRKTLNAGLLGLANARDLVDERPTSQRIHEDLERWISVCIIFGHFRISEKAAQDHYRVARATIREALLLLRDRGLVEKNPYTDWLAGPLTAKTLHEDYRLRELLEPPAFEESAAHLARPEILEMLDRLNSLLDRLDEPAGNAVDQIEQDLHVHCLRHVENDRLRQVIAQVQTPLMVNHIFFSSLRVPADRVSLLEHKAVLQLLLQGSMTAASAALRGHLLQSEKRTLRRLKVLSVLPEPALPSFLERLS